MADVIEIIDVNTWLGAWPFDYLDEDTAEKLDSRLDSEGVSKAYVSTPEAALNSDCIEANRRLIRCVEQYERLHPVATLDPTIGGWKDALTGYCQNGMSVVRIMPGYHDYGCLSDDAVALVDAVAARDMVLIVQMRMADERTHHRLCQIPEVPVDDAMALAYRYPELPVVAMCAYFHEAVKIAELSSNVLFDLSHIERMRTLPSLLSQVPADRVLFGSHAPFLTLRSGRG